MLNVQEFDLLMRLRAGLTSGTEAQRAALAKELDTVLLATTAARASVANAGKRGRGKGSGRGPSVAFTIATEPGGIERVMGSKAAHAALEATLRQLGGRHWPSQQALAVQMSRAGHWSTLLETDNGTVAVSVTREAGTTLATSKDRAKKAKTT